MKHSNYRNANRALHAIQGVNKSPPGVGGSGVSFSFSSGLGVSGVGVPPTPCVAISGESFASKRRRLQHTHVPSSSLVVGTVNTMHADTGACDANLAPPLRE